MWIVEINILGYRFTRRVPRPQEALTLRPRVMRNASLRKPRAA
jgi:hypothetical protein